MGSSRSLLPPTARVMGSRRFKFPGSFLSKCCNGFFWVTVISEAFVSGFGFTPSRYASKTKRAAAGRQSRAGHHLRSRFITSRDISVLPWIPNFLRFILTLGLNFPANSSEESSETAIETLPLYSEAENSYIGGESAR